MATISLTTDTFADTVARDGIVFVDWWAGWCRPCRMFDPVVVRASDNHPDITFGKVDTEAKQEIAMAARISFIPTLIAFRDGILVVSPPGALPAAALEQVTRAVRELDMVEVRNQIAAKANA